MIINEQGQKLEEISTWMKAVEEKILRIEAEIKALKDQAKEKEDEFSQGEEETRSLLKEAEKEIGLLAKSIEGLTESQNELVAVAANLSKFMTGEKERREKIGNILGGG